MAGLLSAAASPQAASAGQSDAGVWNVDAAHSTVASGSATLALRRAQGPNAKSQAGRMIAISGNGVYLITGPMSAEAKGLRNVDFQHMTRTGGAILIGTKPYAASYCGFRCQAGLPESTQRVTFTLVNDAERRVKDMLAYQD
jgi:hypothetical protein